MADWHEEWCALKDTRQDKKWDSFSWLTVRALLSSKNDVVGKKLVPRRVKDLRAAWMVPREGEPLTV